MTLELPHILSFGALITSIIGVIVAARGQARLRSGEFEKQLAAVRSDVDVIKSRLQGQSETERRFWQLCSDVDVLKQQMMLFWKDLSIQSAKVLHSPHTPKLDHLIERFQEDRLTKDELITFVKMLQELHDNKDESTSRRKVAGDLLTAIRVLFIMGTRFLGTALPRLDPQPDIATMLQEHAEETGTGGEPAAGEVPQELPPTCGEGGEGNETQRDENSENPGRLP